MGDPGWLIARETREHNEQPTIRLAGGVILVVKGQEIISVACHHNHVVFGGVVKMLKVVQIPPVDFVDAMGI
jgi:hypothetical protein